MFRLEPDPIFFQIRITKTPGSATLYIMVLLYRKYLSMQLPKGYKETYREILIADSNVVDLHKLGILSLFKKSLTLISLSCSLILYFCGTPSLTQSHTIYCLRAPLLRVRSVPHEARRRRGGTCGIFTQVLQICAVIWTIIPWFMRGQISLI